MEILDRIKSFMDNQQISSSQFADTCKIPRPTISQLLNGRNKKISDEIICKIHSAYSNLSMSWLLFDEGDMLIDSNIKISGAQNNDLTQQKNADGFENESFMGRLDFDTNNSEAIPNNHEHQNHSTITKTLNASNGLINNVIPTKTEKKIQSIIVFYNDNSFETFAASALNEKNKSI